jgi:hypothetical protein
MVVGIEQVSSSVNTSDLYQNTTCPDQGSSIVFLKMDSGSESCHHNHFLPHSVLSNLLQFLATDSIGKWTIDT